MEKPEAQTRTERCLLRAAASWLLAVSAQTLIAGSTQTGGTVVLTVVLTVLLFGALSLAVYLRPVPRLDTWTFAGAVLAAAFIHVAKNSDFYFCLTVIVCLLMAGYLLFARGRLSSGVPELSERAAKRLIAGLAVLLFAFIAGLTTLRYLQYYSPNFDFGIFSNMFHHMRSDLTQTVSCERDTVMSHFDVHISPIYYLMLPFYALVPSPVTLLVVQAAAIACGVIPLCRMAKRRGLKPLVIVLLAAAYLAYPAFTGGCFYDLHENKLLPVLILSAVCCYESKRFLPAFLFAALTLLVKEDAPVYVAVLGLYLALDRRDWRRGAALFFGATAYFVFALFLLDSFGTGVMTWRYANLSDSGLIGVICTVFTDPMRVMAECLNAEKLVFLLQMMLPLLFLPLMTKRPARLILLIPLILVNLMTDYPYQYSVRFQYTYGSGALLFYAAVLNLSDLPAQTGYRLLCGASAAALLLFTSVDVPHTSLILSYCSSAETRAAIGDALAQIPSDASVAADTFFVAHLAKRDLIFEYPSANETEYLVFDLRFGSEEQNEQKISAAYAGGYELVTQTDHAVAVFKIGNETMEGQP